MADRLNPNDFGLKLYNRFPPSYRVDDRDNKYALKRYLEAAADGGFKYVIEEQNGLLDLYDPQTSPLEVVYLLYEQYGLKLFHGIPEEFLRAFLPNLGLAWSKKGSLDVVEFIVSSLSGIKTSTEVTYDDYDNPIVTVRLEMDFSMTDYFPNTEQFKRILENFIPFYCDPYMIYSYVYYVYGQLHGEDYSFETIFDKRGEEARIPYGIHWAWTPLTNTDRMLNVDFELNSCEGYGVEDIPLLNSDRTLNSDFELNQGELRFSQYDTDSFLDKFIYTLEEKGRVLNSGRRYSGGVPLLNTQKAVFGDFVLNGDVRPMQDTSRPLLNMEDNILNNNFVLNGGVDVEEYLDKVWYAPVEEKADTLADDLRLDKFTYQEPDEIGNIHEESEAHEDILVFTSEDCVGLTTKRLQGGTILLGNNDILLNNNFVLNGDIITSKQVGRSLSPQLNEDDIALNDSLVLNDGLVYPSDGLRKSLLNVVACGLNGDFILNDYAELEEYSDIIKYGVIKEELDLVSSDVLQDKPIQMYNEGVSILSRGVELPHDATLGNSVLGEAVLGEQKDFADVCEDNIVIAPMVSYGNLDNTMDTFTNTEYNRLNSSFILAPMTMLDRVTVFGKLNDNFVLNGDMMNETTEVISVLAPAVW